MKIPSFNEDYHKLQKNVIYHHYPEFAAMIEKRYPMEPKWMGKIYLYFHNMNEPPKCTRMYKDGTQCQEYTSFINFTKGYCKYCSTKCASQDNIERAVKIKKQKYGNNLKEISEKTWKTRRERYGDQKEIVNKIKKTKLKRYGDENYNNFIQGEQTKLERYGDKHYNNHEQGKQTKLERYGDEYYSNHEQRLQTNLERYGNSSYVNHEKTEQTNLERYGCECVFQSEKIKNKIKQTNLEKYGYEYATQNKDVQEKIKQTKLEYYGDENYNNRNQAKQTNLNKYGVEWTVYLLKDNSNLEQIVCSFLEKMNIEYIHNNPKNYKIIPPQQIDIYIPSLNIAIEINGEYHHSIILKEEQYHMNKWRKCYDKNIELISLWGDWFKNTKDVENFLYKKLNNLNINDYKTKWFSELKGNEWPLDLGWIDDLDLSSLKEHPYYHGNYNYPCYDSGIFLKSS